jgi:serine-type D-Ala-D-Ala carboxypeptidase/endopeptidase (penicillin-binding protein 4)
MVQRFHRYRTALGGNRVHYRPRRLPVFLVLFSLLIPGLAINARADTLETIRTKIAQYLKRPGVRAASWGIEILDPANSEVLLAVNADKTFTPASVMKVVTTSAALEKLGSDFRFRTGVYTDGELQPDGTLVGNLILVGRGDPNLMDPYGELIEKPALQELAENLKAAGVKKIQGNLIGDDSYFDPASSANGWSAQQLKSVYGAPINALSTNNNAISVNARPSKLNSLVAVSIEPQTSYFRIRNLATTGGPKSKRTIGAKLISDSKTIVVSGVLPRGQTFGRSLVIDKPSLVSTLTFGEELKKHGITVSGNVEAIHSGDLPPTPRDRWTLLTEHISPPLIRALEIINKRSQNLHAEMLLRTLGAEFKGAGTDAAGLQVVRDFLVEAGIESDKVQLNDGCGLSRENLITPRFQTSLLQFLSTRPYFDLFLNTLAVSGTDGTLRNRMGSEQVKGYIRAKTGTLNGVSTLSGYMTTKSGRNLAFSIFANNVHVSMARVKKTIDEICTLFVNLY